MSESLQTQRSELGRGPLISRFSPNTSTSTQPKVAPPSLLEQTLLYFDANQGRFPKQTTHGSGADNDADSLAETFGNVVNSGMSSLGFARTRDTYSGTYRVSVRLDGLSPSNSNIRERVVVYHGWDKVYERDVIQKVKGGSLTNFGFTPKTP